MNRALSYQTLDSFLGDPHGTWPEVRVRQFKMSV